MNPAHLDHRALADLAEGLLDDDHAASANAHLDDCAECRERSAEVADVSRLLADIPVPPMPADLAARIDEAIRAESMATAATPGGRIHSLEHRRRRRHARLFAAAAATLVAVGGGTLLGTELLDGDDARNSHTAPPADPPRRPGPGEAAAYPVTASGTHYRAATLGDQVADVVTRGRTLTAHRPPGARLAGCVEEHTRGVKPVLVDAATFESREATVIVIPADASTWRVVVAGPGCGPGVPDVLRRTDIPARTP